MHHKWFFFNARKGQCLFLDHGKFLLHKKEIGIDKGTALVTYMPWYRLYSLTVTLPGTGPAMAQ